MRAGGGHVDGERRNGVRRQRADRRDRLNAGLEGGHAANLSRGAHASVICQERERGGGGGEGQPAFLGRSCGSTNGHNPDSAFKAPTIQKDVDENVPQESNIPLHYREVCQLSSRY